MVKHTQTVDLLQADQRTGPVKAIRSAEGMEISFNMMELTLENWYSVLNRGTVTKTGRVLVVTLTGFDGTDSFKLTYAGVEDGTAFTRGSTYTLAQLQSQLRTDTGDSGLLVSAVSDAGFTVTFTEAILTGKTGALSVTSPSGCTGAVVETNPSERTIKPYQDKDVSAFVLLVRGPSPYMSAFLQYYVPMVVQTDEPEAAFVRDNKAVLAVKLAAIEDPNAATAADRFGNIIAQTS